jgi:ribosome biogenesis GTPase
LKNSQQHLLHGQVVAVHGRHYLVELAGGERLACFPRGKKSLVACGDRVEVLRSALDQGVIEAVDPRRSLLYRSDQYRQKLIAANVTQMVIVLAVVPSFYEELLNRCLIAAEHQGIAVLIVLNKFDLIEPSTRAMEALRPYADLGYPLLPLVAKQDVSPLREHLAGHTSVLVGQSGMGKSTIINALIPGTGAATSDVSAALDSGRHTTTHARLYHLDAKSHLIDSPGMQEFGLHHLTEQDVAGAFREFRPLTGCCRFRNCRHLVEPGCAIAQAVEEGKVNMRRLDAYRKLAKEIKSGKRF